MNMRLKRELPNIITLLNLLCGVIATMLASIDKLPEAAFLVLLGIFFDFFDGFVARLLNVQSELGKQLDSLADMVTSGVVPGIVMFQLLRKTNVDWITTDWFVDFSQMNWFPFTGLLVTLSACYRLANFNIDSRQTNSFIGLPTPALTLFIISLPLILKYSNIEFANSIIHNQWFLIATIFVGSYLMNANLPLFSLKFKDYSFKNNVIKYIFLIVSIILLIVLKLVAIPVIIIVYVLFSLIDNVIKKNKLKASLN